LLPPRSRRRSQKATVLLEIDTTQKQGYGADTGDVDHPEGAGTNDEAGDLPGSDTTQEPPNLGGSRSNRALLPARSRHRSQKATILPGIDTQRKPPYLGGSPLRPGTPTQNTTQKASEKPGTTAESDTDRTTARKRHFFPLSAFSPGFDTQTARFSR
jgi:hypothetical protein